MKIKLRNWQREAHNKAIDWLVARGEDRHFLINAAPGAGKTLASCAIAETLIQMGEIERVIVIAPRSEVVNQWAEDFRFVTSRHMAKVTAADGDIEGLSVDVCATWAAIQDLLPELQAVCRANKTLVICDEHHHAAVEAAWGRGADGAFADGRYVLVLTGTPISLGLELSQVVAGLRRCRRYRPPGRWHLHPHLTVRQSILGTAAPLTFHRHEGKFTRRPGWPGSEGLRAHEKAGAAAPS